MQLIDDDGNLFGAVNVIDALAVLLILAIVVAGIAVVGVLGDGGEPETRHATMDLGTQPDYVVDRIEAGDEMPIDGFGHNLTVTDVYVTTASGDDENGDTQVIVRVEVNGERIEREDDDPIFEFAGDRLRVGDDLEFETDEYVADGQVTSLDRNGPELNVETTPVLLESTVSANTIDEISEGDTVEAGSGTIAVVQTVQSQPVGDGEYRIRLGIDLETLQRGSTPTFADQSVSIGNELTLDLDAYSFSGEVLRRGTTDLDVETTPVLLESTVSANTADEISEGDTVEAGSDTVATVQRVQPYPVGDDQYRLHLGVDLETFQHDSTPMFAAQPLSVGNTLELEFDTYSVSGEILRRGATEIDAEAEDTTVELKLENVDPDVANGLDDGMTETVRGEPLATIQSVDTRPADIVLESEDGDIHLREHPTNKDVRLTVELRTVETDSGIRFHGDSLREGDDVFLDFGTMSVDGTVTTLNVDG